MKPINCRLLACLYLCLFYLGTQFIFLTSLGATTSLSNDNKAPSNSELKVMIYGYPDFKEKKYNIENFNPLQAESLALLTPGLTVAKLGSAGQRTSLRYNSYTAGDLTFLFDGFEISDPSDPSEGFEISSFLMVPNFDLKISSSDSMGLFSRQTGGVISVDPLMSEKSFVRSAFGSENQSLLSAQKNFCKRGECLSLGLGGTYVTAQSASTQKSELNTKASPLELDHSGLGYFSLGYQKSFGSNQLLKVRAHSQYSQTDIDDYNQDFIYVDDPNARLLGQNHFFGVSFLSDSNQYFLENTLLDRAIVNDLDGSSLTLRDEKYNVFRSKLRGSHILFPTEIHGLDFYWYAQHIRLKTQKIDSLNSLNSNDISRFEYGVQLDKKSLLYGTEFISSLNFNELSSFGSGLGLTQNIQSTLIQMENTDAKIQTYFGFKERRPSFFQLFDPQFGNSGLNPEQLFFLRPKIKAVFKSASYSKHNISLEYFFENINSRVIFVANPNPTYNNSSRLRSNSFVFDYQFDFLNYSARVFYRKSLDPEFILRSLPWSTSEETGLGGGFHSKWLGKLFVFSADIKWLMGMYNPSQKLIGNLVQSQASVSFQLNPKDSINLQLNNLFNDKKIWDEGFRRQSFSWMIGFTKTI